MKHLILLLFITSSSLFAAPIEIEKLRDHSFAYNYLTVIENETEDNLDFVLEGLTIFAPEKNYSREKFKFSVPRTACDINNEKGLFRCYVSSFRRNPEPVRITGLVYVDGENVIKEYLAHRVLISLHRVITDTPRSRRYQLIFSSDVHMVEVGSEETIVINTETVFPEPMTYEE